MKTDPGEIWSCLHDHLSSYAASWLELSFIHYLKESVCLSFMMMSFTATWQFWIQWWRYLSCKFTYRLRCVANTVQRITKLTEWDKVSLGVWNCGNTSSNQRWLDIPTLTCLPLSWGSRPGGTPRAVAPRKCRGPLKRWPAPRRNFPVRWSPQRCRRWRCCSNYPAGAQEEAAFKIMAGAGITYTRTKWIHKDL